MPESKTKQVSRIARRRRVVGALVAGKELKEIAAAEKVHPRTIARVLAQPQTQFEISELVEQHGPELRALFAASLTAVREALVATTLLQTGPEAWDKVADHRTRLGAVEQVRRIMQLAGTLGEGGDARRPGWTWVEFRQMWMESRGSRGAAR